MRTDHFQKDVNNILKSSKYLISNKKKYKLKIMNAQAPPQIHQNRIHLP